jgi:Uncharacterised nucleotidyltransferase
LRSANSDSGLQSLVALLNGAVSGNGQWDSVVEEANRHLVAPALYACLRDRDLLDLVPVEVEAYLRFLYGLNEDRNRRLKRQAVETLGVLNEARIEPLLIKGSALLMIIPEHRLGTRMVSDLDLVVGADEVERSAERLLGIGYQPLQDNAGLHAYGKFYRSSDVGSIDLHLRPPGPAHLFAGSGAHQSAAHEVLGVRMRIPTPGEWVTQLIIHDMIQDRRLRTGDVDLRRLLDCREILNLGYEIDWGEIRERLPAGRLALARDLFFLNLQRLVGVRVDDGAVGFLVKVLFSRQIALRRNATYRRLDSLGLAMLGGSWKLLKLSTAAR